MEELDLLNAAILIVTKSIVAASQENPPYLKGAFFIPHDGSPDFASSITSFLCIDVARAIFIKGSKKLDGEPLKHSDWKFLGRAADNSILPSVKEETFTFPTICKP